MICRRRHCQICHYSIRIIRHDHRWCMVHYRKQDTILDRRQWLWYLDHYRFLDQSRFVGLCGKRMMMMMWVMFLLMILGVVILPDRHVGVNRGEGEDRGILILQPQQQQCGVICIRSVVMVIGSVVTTVWIRIQVGTLIRRFFFLVLEIGAVGATQIQVVHVLLIVSPGILFHVLIRLGH